MNARLTPLEQEAENRAVQEREAESDRRRAVIGLHRTKWRQEIEQARECLHRAAVQTAAGNLTIASHQAYEALARIAEARVHRAAFEVLEGTAL